MKTALALAFLMLCAPDASAWEAHGRALTQELEGFSATAYTDTRGIQTIGYGFNCAYHSCDKMTRDHAREVFLLKYDEATARAVRFSASAWVQMTAGEKIAIVDMAYNLGNRLFKFKRLRVALQERGTQGIIREMRSSKWYHQTGTRPERLISIIDSDQRLKIIINKRG